MLTCSRKRGCCPSCRCCGFSQTHDASAKTVTLLFTQFSSRQLLPPAQVHASRCQVFLVSWRSYINVSPELQVSSAELPRPEAQAEHAPARLQLATQHTARTKTVYLKDFREVFIATKDGAFKSGKNQNC